MKDKISDIKTKAIENFVPIVRDNTIEKIISILQDNQYKNILEIGTAVGYSAIMMLSNSNAYLTSIEKDEERYKQATQNIKECKLEDRAYLILGDAFEELERLLKANKKFDFIFLDGPKGQYIKYYPILKELLNKKGTLFADNILMSGLLEDETKVNHKNRTMVRNMRAFIEKIQADKDFQTDLYKIDDGFSISILN